MPVIVKYDDTKPLNEAKGVVRRELLNAKAIGSDRLVLSHLSLESGGAYPLTVPATGMAWLQILEGRVNVQGHDLTTSAMTALPPGWSGAITGVENAKVLLGVVPNAAAYEPTFAASPPGFTTFDLTREPVLSSEHDARKRIYIATPTLLGTKALKGEIIIYPPGTAAAKHHHEGAEHFQYIMAGSGTAYLEDEPHQLKAGDVLYNYEREAHYFINDGKEDFVFVEFFVPGDCKTVWAPEANVCAWLPTGSDIKGRTPVREIGYHVHGEDKGKGV